MEKRGKNWILFIIFLVLFLNIGLIIAEDGFISPGILNTDAQTSGSSVICKTPLLKDVFACNDKPSYQVASSCDEKCEKKCSLKIVEKSPGETSTTTPSCSSESCPKPPSEIIQDLKEVKYPYHDGSACCSCTCPEDDSFLLSQIYISLVDVSNAIDHRIASSGSLSSEKPNSFGIFMADATNAKKKQELPPMTDEDVANRVASYYNILMLFTGNTRHMIELPYDTERLKRETELFLKEKEEREKLGKLTQMKTEADKIKTSIQDKIKQSQIDGKNTCPKRVFFSGPYPEGKDISVEAFKNQDAVIPIVVTNLRNTKTICEVKINMPDQSVVNSKELAKEPFFMMSPGGNRIVILKIKGSDKDIKGSVKTICEYQNPQGKYETKETVTNIERKVSEKPKDSCCAFVDCYNKKPDFIQSKTDPNEVTIWVVPDKNGYQVIWEQEFVNKKYDYITRSIRYKSTDGIKLVMPKGMGDFTQKKDEMIKTKMGLEGKSEGKVKVRITESSGSLSRVVEWTLIVRFKTSIDTGCIYDMKKAEDEASDAKDQKDCITDPTPVKPPVVEPKPPVVSPPAPPAPPQQKKTYYFPTFTKDSYYYGNEGNPNGPKGPHVSKTTIYIEYEQLKELVKKKPSEEEFRNTLIKLPRIIIIDTVRDGITKKQLIDGFIKTVKEINNAIKGYCTYVGTWDSNPKTHPDITEYNKANLWTISSSEAKTISEIFGSFLNDIPSSGLGSGSRIILERNSCKLKILILDENKAVIYSGSITDKENLELISKMFTDMMVLKDQGNNGLRKDKDLVVNPDKVKTSEQAANIESNIDRIYRYFTDKESPGYQERIDNLVKGEGLVSLDND